jgi:hypothetical protein
MEAGLPHWALGIDIACGWEQLGDSLQVGEGRQNQHDKPSTLCPVMVFLQPTTKGNGQALTSTEPYLTACLHTVVATNYSQPM